MSRRRAKRKRRIAVITGTRAEYGLLTSTMRAIEAHPRLDLQLVVTGMHLLKRFGYTVQTILRDGWRIDARVRMQTGSDDPLDQAAGLSRGVAGIARFLEAAQTDIVVVLGDRIEAMAGALAAVTTGRVLAHVHGGDVAPGDFDDSLRHAITKLAHVHFAATRNAARRIVKLGEHSDRVHVVGAPGLDRLRELLTTEPRPCSGRSPCRPWKSDDVRTRHAWQGRVGRGGPSGSSSQDTADTAVALVVYHAWGRPAATEARTMGAILKAVESVGLRRLTLYPNTDRGHRGVLQAIERHEQQSHPDDVGVIRSLPRDDYLRALIQADVLVGNSSSGIIEAPLAGTPSINVGRRQAGRLPGGTSVLQVEETPAAIRAGIQAALRKRTKPGCKSVYGDGWTGRQIAHILAELPLTQESARKLITY